MSSKPLVFTNDMKLSATLKRGSIYRIKGQRPYPSSDGRGHFFIVLNHVPKSGQVLVLTHGTSQVQDAVEDAINKREAAGTVVVIPPGKYDIFPRQTAIDCNQAITMPFSDLIEIMDEGNLNIDYTELDPKDLDDVVQGVLGSRQIDEVMKAPLREPAEAANE